jgi:hypothetical protein
MDVALVKLAFEASKETQLRKIVLSKGSFVKISRAQT